MRFVALAWMAFLAAAATPAAAQSGDGGPQGGFTTPNVDHSLQNSACGSMESSANSICKNGMVFNKQGDVARKDEVRARAMAEVHTVSLQREEAARKLADRVRAGAEVPPALVEQVRAGLGRDLELWRAEYGVNDKEWTAASARWMRDAASLTPAEWVLWREAWFDERNKWLAARPRQN